MLKYEVTVCELWRDEFSYSENTPYYRRIVEIPEKCSSLSFARRVLRAAGYANCGARQLWDSESWRVGMTGIYALPVEG